MMKAKTKLLYASCLALSMLSVSCSDANESDNPDNPEKVTAYITRVLDFRPAPGQYTNTMPAYEDGDTQETMNQKVLEAIGENRKGLISNYGKKKKAFYIMRDWYKKIEKEELNNK